MSPDEDAGERGRGVLLYECRKLSATQQLSLVDYLWLSAQAPRETARLVEQKLVQFLEIGTRDAQRITQALDGAIDELRDAVGRPGG